ncbi:MAG: 2-oxoacid:acceptor oxidoreductase subunit alpha [Tissierellales bacterium]|jgi:2-oxoglutarate ferredoxin oxidoreductase subunit alpha|nr:2-oxoacid:acceptor oxidoreductase subunit alpha [Tissierellales bacterium]
MNKNKRLMQGNEACVEGALAAGMKFFAGYPITPSTELAELSSVKLPIIGGKFIQMEDEIAAMAATIGGSLAGLKSMTATSGPGFSLKQENFGYACMTEIPCVVVNVQRGGPSTGLPTSPAQGEVMQAKWGTHGDHPVIALTPSSVRETFDLTIRAFNLAEKYRTPVILLMDETIAHMREKIEIPDASDIEIIDRKTPEVSPENYRAYEVKENEWVPPIAPFGSGYKFHVTGLSHGIDGFPSNDGTIAEDLITRLVDKVEMNKDDICEHEAYKTDDAELVVVAYGGSARAAKSAVDIMRKDGYKVGLLRPITIWPLIEDELVEMSKQVSKYLVVEMNKGQYLREVERVAENEVFGFGKVNGELFKPSEIVEKIKEVM